MTRNPHASYEMSWLLGVTEKTDLVVYYAARENFSLARNLESRVQSRAPWIRQKPLF